MKGGRRGKYVLRLPASPARSASWFVPASRDSTADRPVQVHRAYDDLDLTLLDEMALVSATPLGVDEVVVPVGIEGLRQDWGRVGQLLRNAMGVASKDGPQVSRVDEGKS